MSADGGAIVKIVDAIVMAWVGVYGGLALVSGAKAPYKREKRVDEKAPLFSSDDSIRAMAKDTAR